MSALAATSGSKTRVHYQSLVTGAARCGRQLHSGREGELRAITGQQGLELSPDPFLVTCTHCLRAMGLQPPVVRRIIPTAESLDSGEDFTDE
jgi:hypothetical protein